MSLVREERLYKAYCDLCFCTDKKRVSKDEWKKQFGSSSNVNKQTAENVQKEL